MNRFGMALLLCAVSVSLSQGDEPARKLAANNLPRYDLDIAFSCDLSQVDVVQRVQWTNGSSKATNQIFFNAHSHFSIPDDQIGLLAKMAELLRMTPKEAMSFDGPALRMQSIARMVPGKGIRYEPVVFGFSPESSTTLIVDFPNQISPGETVTLELKFQMKLPPRKGRWGQWEGITMLAQWLPVVSVHDDEGWHPAPFIPWHQPFHNEAGHYTARIKLPKDVKFAAAAPVQETRELDDDWVQHVMQPICVRDYSIVASPHFIEHCGQAGGVKIRCLTTPEHAWYGEKAVQYAAEAIPVYNQWFGAYPFPQFTIVEGQFGWNGNECGAMVMIDYRMFAMPHAAHGYVDYLVSHELCHQWWYNVVGTNGYAETWMDEGLATYFSHRLVDQKVGKGNALIDWPKGLTWLPNISRDDFRNYGMIGATRRGDATPVVQEMPKFGHLANLTAMTYDKGSRIVGMIENRMGEAAFFDFMRVVYRKYQFRILRVKDFQRELEEYTGRSWEEFFREWLYDRGSTDWAIDRVEVDGKKPHLVHRRQQEPVRVAVYLEQRGKMDEPTVVGFKLKDGADYQVRVPVSRMMEAGDQAIQIPEVGATIRPTEKIQSNPLIVVSPCVTVVEIDLPCEPIQITVDPDRMLVDSEPTNNHWKPECRYRFTPFYTQLDESDVTNSHDRWNFIAGPYLFMNAYADPWYIRSPLAGVKLGAYKTQEFVGGAFMGYRTNDRNVVVGAEAVWDHFPSEKMQAGFNVEHSLATLGGDPIPYSRAAFFMRYILMYGSSLYLPPFEYVEGFAAFQNRGLPNPDINTPGADPFNERPTIGLHYHKYMLTPYWDAQGGAALDLSYQYGAAVLGNHREFHQVHGQVSTVKYLPSWFTNLSDGPIMSYLKETRFAFRLGGSAALPDNGEFFTLGGGDQFRGYGLSERQGNMTWVGSIEWRLPIAQNVNHDFCDHFVGVRNVYLAPFYDIGDAYLDGHSLGPVAHAVGVGLRVDMVWLSLIERTMLRFDVAQTLGGNSPVQFWFGFQHPF